MDLRLDGESGGDDLEAGGGKTLCRPTSVDGWASYP